MACQDLFQWRDKKIHTRWGYNFHLTKDHLNINQMNQMKTSYDELGDEALKRLKLLLPSNVTNSVPSHDLVSTLRDNVNKDSVLNQLWEEVSSVPSWVCWEQISRGQDCFYRYGGPALTGLAFQSLLGGMVGQKIIKDNEYC